MSQLVMPRGKVGSPVAQLTAPITDTSTYIPFNTSNLPDDVPNVTTVGTELLFESIWYTSKDAGGVYTTNGGQRGFDGTTARSWAQGTNVARYICEYDMYARKANIEDHETRILQNVSVIAANEARLVKLEDPVYNIDKTTTEPVSLDFSSGAIGDNFVASSGSLDEWAITDGKLSVVSTTTTDKVLRKIGMINGSGVYQTKFRLTNASQYMVFRFDCDINQSVGWYVQVAPSYFTVWRIGAGVAQDWAYGKTYINSVNVDHWLRIVYNNARGIMEIYFSDDGVTFTLAATSNIVAGETDQYTKFLTHFTTISRTLTGQTVTAVGGCATSTTQKKFGLTSAYFDGVDDLLTVPDSDDWYFGTGDFTIDAWVYPTDLTVNRAIVSQHATTAEQWIVKVNTTGIIEFTVITGGTAIGSYLFDSGIVINQWQHIELCRVSGAFKLFVNGVEKTATIATDMGATAFPNIAAALTFGMISTSTIPYKGYMDEIRISKGIARHTANFTPLTREYLGSTIQYVYPITTGGITQIGFRSNSGSMAGCSFDDLIITPLVEYLDTFTTNATIGRYWLTNAEWGATGVILMSTANALAVLKSYCYGEGDYSASFIATTADAKTRFYLRRTDPAFQTGTGYFIEFDTAADTMRWYKYSGSAETAIGNAVSVTLAPDTVYTPAINVTSAGVMTCVLNGVSCAVTDTTYTNYGYVGVGKGNDATEVKWDDLSLCGVEHPCGDPNLYRGVQSGFVDDFSVNSMKEYDVNATHYEFNDVGRYIQLKTYANNGSCVSPYLNGCGNGVYEVMVKPTVYDTTSGSIKVGLAICSTVTGATFNTVGYYARVEFINTKIVNIYIYSDFTTALGSAVVSEAQDVDFLNRWYKLQIVFNSPTITASVYDDTGVIIATKTETNSTYTIGRFGFTNRTLGGIITGDGRMICKDIKFTPTEPTRFIGGVNHGARYDVAEHLDLTYLNPYKRGLTELELTSQTTYITPALNGVKVGCTNVTDSTRVGEYPIDRLLEQSQTPIDDAVLVDHNTDDVGDWITCAVTRNQPATDNQPVTAISTMKMVSKWGER